MESAGSELRVKKKFQKKTVHPPNYSFFRVLAHSGEIERTIEDDFCLHKRTSLYSKKCF